MAGVIAEDYFGSFYTETTLYHQYSLQLVPTSDITFGRNNINGIFQVYASSTILCCLKKEKTSFTIFNPS
jgi:hypothetical protein